MLILTAKPGESIQIGENIRITALPKQGGQVKLGFEAPREIKILRDNAKKRDPS